MERRAMTDAIEAIREAAASLLQELTVLVSQGYALDPDERSYGYLYAAADDAMVETRVLHLKVSEGTLYAFMVPYKDGNDYSEEEALGFWHDSEAPFLPGWHAVDDGFYGLTVPTLMSIAEGLTVNKYNNK